MCAPSATTVMEAPADRGVTMRRSAVAGTHLTASRGKDFQALHAVLDPDVVLRADTAAQP